MRKLAAAVVLGPLLLSIGCGTSTSPQQQQQRDAVCLSITSGNIIDDATGKPPASATVALESTRTDGPPATYQIDWPVAHTDQSGHFKLDCVSYSSDPATKYLLNITAADNEGRQYAPVIITDFPAGALLGTDIGAFSVGGTGRSPVPAAIIQGSLTTASSSNTPVVATYNVTLYQNVTDATGDQFTLPVQADAIFDPPPVDSTTVCYPTGVCVGSSYQPQATTASASCPPGTACATYSLQSLPSVAPVVRRWVSAGEVQSPDPPLYAVSATVFVGLHSNIPNCAPSTRSTSSQTNGKPLNVAPGAQLTATPFAFTGCQ